MLVGGVEQNQDGPKQISPKGGYEQRLQEYDTKLEKMSQVVAAET